MLQHALLVLLLPLASAAAIALFLRRSGGVASILSTATAAAIAGFALLLALNNERFSESFEWLRLGNFALSIGFKFDDLAALMLVIVGIVGLCVHVFFSPAPCWSLSPPAFLSSPFAPSLSCCTFQQSS